MAFIACSEDSTDYDQYYNWKSRNTVWYQQIADSARTAISQARASHGDDWEQYCDWRMYKSLLRSPSYQSGALEDSICVRIISRGDGTVMPMSTDSVYISFRGTLMPTTDADGHVVETIFSQTYYGAFEPATAAPQLSVVNAFTEGFQTALQYMVEGDDWRVYIPQELFYGEKAQGIIPAYSAACFRINVTKVIVAGTSS